MFEIWKFDGAFLTSKMFCCIFPEREKAYAQFQEDMIILETLEKGEIKNTKKKKKSKNLSVWKWRKDLSI